MKKRNKLISLLELYTTYIMTKSRKTEKNVWLFGEWFGERCGDNCTYFANYLAKEHPEIDLFWIAKSNADLTQLDKRIRVCEMDSEEAGDIIRKAGAVFVNQSFSDICGDGLNRFGGALTVNFWHGMMWKKIGHDGDKRTGMLFRAYCKVLDFVRRPNSYVILSDEYGQKIKTAFNGLEKGFIKAGYPRNSIFYKPSELMRCKKLVTEKLSQENDNLITEASRIIAYMPTFRDKGSRSVDLSDITDKGFLEWLEKEDIVIVQKAHFVDQKRDVKGSKNKGRIITYNNIDAATLMAAADMLVTDYSSCFFDYLILDRPIVHFLYDYDYYRNNDRGVYYDKEEVVCGDVAESISELCALIKENMLSPDKNRQLRDSKFKRFMQYESEDANEVIYRYVCRRIGLQ